LSIYSMMVVTRERQKIRKSGRVVSFKMKNCPSSSFLGTILFFILLALGFPGEDFLIHSSVPQPVGGEIRKAAISAPLVGESKSTIEKGQPPVLPFLTYQVEEGETLSLIASRYSLKSETLITLNKLSDPHELVPGGSLYIPSQDGSRKKLSGDMTTEELASIYSLSPDLLIPLGGEEYFLPGAVPAKEEISRFWKDNFSYPLNGTVTGEYGVSKDSLTGLETDRRGLEFRTYPGQDIYSVGDGVVSKAGFHGAYGWYIIVNHQDGFQSLYAHLESFEVSEGEKVERGEFIASAGNSGHTVGNLLFFSLFHEGDPVNPREYLF
jgi:murein DD-endopeptidase MepM/ murein hydrolase activator NlpD